MKAIVRRLDADDLRAYKALRDEMLRAHPDAFTSDAAGERLKPPHAYLGRLGLDRPEGGHFLLGAFAEGVLIGALGCDRDARPKVRHLAQVVGMMVRPEWRGRGVATALLQASRRCASGRRRDAHAQRDRGQRQRRAPLPARGLRALRAAARCGARIRALARQGADGAEPAVKLPPRSSRRCPPGGLLLRTGGAGSAQALGLVELR
jgi:GNAT superfamily N-acetyltransferase